MIFKSFYDNRYTQKVEGRLERISAFHRADNRSFYRDLLRWGFLYENFRILDVGCGWAIHLDLMVRNNSATVVKTDLSIVALNRLRREEVESIKGRISYSIVNAEDIPFSDNTFDLVMCSQVLEHIPDDSKTLSEFHRALRKGGLLVLAVPNCVTDMYPIFQPLEKRFDEAGHIHEYCIEDVRNILTRNGFHIETKRYHCFFTFWFIAWLERTFLGKYIQWFLSAIPLLESACEWGITYLLMFENELLGNKSKGSMSIQFVARKV